MSVRHIQFEKRRKKVLVKQFNIFIFREDNVRDQAKVSEQKNVLSCHFKNPVT